MEIDVGKEKFDLAMSQQKVSLLPMVIEKLFFFLKL
jgi:hypothetical protein